MRNKKILGTSYTENAGCFTACLRSKNSLRSLNSTCRCSLPADYTPTTFIAVPVPFFFFTIILKFVMNIILVSHVKQYQGLLCLQQ